MNATADSITDQYGSEVLRCWLIVKNQGKKKITLPFIQEFCDEWNLIRKEINNNAKEYGHNNRK